MLHYIKKGLLALFSITLVFSQKPLKLGSVAPDFKLKDQDGHPHTLLMHRGQFILLFFYPRDNTPHCTKQALSFQKQIEEYRQKNVVIFGVSQDSSTSHKKFKSALELGYDLLSDPNGSVSKMYHAKGFIMNKRMAYLIGPDGKIFKVYKDIKPAKYSSCVVNDLALRDTKLNSEQNG
jgi:thioredoxin-dependent peroxiredoxin